MLMGAQKLGEDSDPQHPFNLEPVTQAEYVKAIYHDMLEVKKQTTETNGRVTALETWKKEVDIKRQVADAYALGLGQSLITKSQWKMIAGLLISVSTLTATLIGIAYNLTKWLQ